MKIRVHFAPRHRAALLAVGVLVPLCVSAQTPSLGTVVVTASRTETLIDEQLADITVLDRSAIERSGAQGLVDLLATQPGIQVTPDSVRGANASVFVRGANNSQTLVLVDGQRVSSATTGATALHHLPLELIDRVEILRGSASSLYGSDAMGGVIQVFTRSGRGDPSISGSVTVGSYGTQNLSLAYGGKSGDTRFSLQAGAETTRGFGAIREASGGAYDAYNPDRDGYIQRNLGLSLAQQISSTLELGLAYLVTEGRKRTDAVSFGSSYLTPVTANYDNRDQQRLQNLALRANWKVTPDWTSKLQIGVSQDFMRAWRYDPTPPVELVDTYATVQRQASWQNEVRMGPGLVMAAWEWRSVKADTSNDLVTSGQQTHSATLGYQAWIGSHLFQASARRDDVQDVGASNTGTLAYGYRIADGWVARASAGTGFHAPSFNDLYWPVDPVNQYRGNPNLKPERSRSVEAGLTYESGDTRVSATAYRNRVRDLIEYRYDESILMGEMRNVSSATLEGVSLQARSRSNGWTLSGTVDVQDPRSDITGNTLQRRVPKSATLDISRSFDKLTLGGAAHAFSQRFNDAKNRQPIPGFALLNLRANYQLQKNLDLTAQVRNALNKEYVVEQGSDRPYNNFGTAGRAFYLSLRFTGI